jgi:Pyruvate/2-oxoacid:ferredoxin oxidoreductase delta subunit
VLTPPPAVNYILTALVLICVFIWPLSSGNMADLNTQPTSFDIDWFFLWPYAMLSQMPVGGYWAVMVFGTIAITALPWLMIPKQPAIETAEVVLNKCTGCSLCYKDCPYQAIEMVPAPAGSRFKLLATVKDFRCSGCGVCVGACAFDAIDLPDLPDAEVNAKIKALLEAKG